MTAPSGLLKLIHKADDETVAALCAVLADEEVRRYLPFMKAPGLTEVRAFLNRLLDGNSRVWVICDKGVPAGIIDLIKIEKGTARLAYFLGRPYWGRGLGKAALKLVLDYAREELNLHHIIAPVLSRNKGSIKILQKNGFTPMETLKRTVAFDGNPDQVHLYSLTWETPKA